MLAWRRTLTVAMLVRIVCRRKLRLATQFDRFRNARLGEGAPQFTCWSVSTCSLQLKYFWKLLGGVSSEAVAYSRSALASA